MRDPLKIVGFKMVNTPIGKIPVPIGLFIAQYNPESFSVTNVIIRDETMEPGSVELEAAMNKKKPRKFNFKFLLDGTGASVKVNLVKLQIEAFKMACGVYLPNIGLMHEPNPLLIQLGTFVVICNLAEYTIDYELFSKFGLPLRATINATFQEDEKYGKFVGLFSSPDLTHAKEINAADQLHNLCVDTYENPFHNINVARHNELDTIRELEPGASIFLPPLDKSQH